MVVSIRVSAQYPDACNIGCVASLCGTFQRCGLMRLVLIEWEDSHADGVWRVLSGSVKDRALVCRSVGWLVLDGERAGEPGGRESWCAARYSTFRPSFNRRSSTCGSRRSEISYSPRVPTRTIGAPASTRRWRCRGCRARSSTVSGALRRPRHPLLIDRARTCRSTTCNVTSLRWRASSPRRRVHRAEDSGRCARRGRRRSPVRGCHGRPAGSPRRLRP